MQALRRRRSRSLLQTNLEHHTNGTQFDTTIFQQTSDATTPCTPSVECDPRFSEVRAGIVSVYAINMRIRALGLCTGARCQSPLFFLSLPPLRPWLSRAELAARSPTFTIPPQHIASSSPGASLHTLSYTCPCPMRLCTCSFALPQAFVQTFPVQIAPGFGTCVIYCIRSLYILR